MTFCGTRPQSINGISCARSQKHLCIRSFCVYRFDKLHLMCVDMFCTILFICLYVVNQNIYYIYMISTHHVCWGQCTARPVIRVCGFWMCVARLSNELVMVVLHKNYFIPTISFAKYVSLYATTFCIWIKQLLIGTKECRRNTYEWFDLWNKYMNSI